MSKNNFGNDLILKDGDILGNYNGDFFTVADYEKSLGETDKFPGYQNAIFALTDRLLTVQGDNQYYPKYGSELFNYISAPNSPNTIEGVKTAVQNSLIYDPRVKEIESVEVKVDKNTILISAKIILIGSNTPYDFVFPKIVME